MTQNQNGNQILENNILKSNVDSHDKKNNNKKLPEFYNDSAFKKIINFNSSRDAKSLAVLGHQLFGF